MPYDLYVYTPPEKTNGWIPKNDEHLGKKVGLLLCTLED